MCVAGHTRTLCLEQGFRTLSQSFKSLEETGSLFWMLCDNPAEDSHLLGSAHAMEGEHSVFLCKDIQGLLKSKALLLSAVPGEMGLVWGSSGHFGCRGCCFP